MATFAKSTPPAIVVTTENSNSIDSTTDSTITPAASSSNEVTHAIGMDYTEFLNTVNTKNMDMIVDELDPGLDSDSDQSTRSLPVTTTLDPLLSIQRTPANKRRRGPDFERLSRSKLTPNSRIKSSPKKLAEVMMMVKQQVDIQVADKFNASMNRNIQSAVKEAIDPLLRKLDEKDKKIDILEGIVSSLRSGSDDSASVMPLNPLITRIIELEDKLTNLLNRAPTAELSEESIVTRLDNIETSIASIQNRAPVEAASIDGSITERLDNIESRIQSAIPNSKIVDLETKVNDLCDLSNFDINSPLILREHDKFVLQTLDDHEQYSRRNCLRITGVFAENTDNTTDIVKKVCDSIGVKAQNSDISRSHFVGKPRSDGARMIIVRFISYEKRLEVILNRSKLRNLPAQHAFSKSHINEDLTKRRYLILQTMIRDKKDGIIASCWSRDGNLYYKDSERSPAKKVYNTIMLCGKLITFDNQKNSNNVSSSTYRPGKR